MARTEIRFRISVSVLVLAAAGFLLWLFWPKVALLGLDTADTPEALTSTSPIAIEAAVVERGDLSVTAEATGHLEAWRRVEVRPEVTARVVDLEVRDSAWVEEGHVLFRLDDRQSQLDLAEAQADLLKAQAQFAVDYRDPTARDPLPASEARHAEIERDHQEVEALFEQGLIARDALDQARRRREAAQLLLGGERQRVRSAVSGLSQTEHRVDRLRLAVARSRIEAPFAGRVADVVVEVGQHVTAGDACLTLLDDTRMKVEVEVLESDFVHLRPGAAAWVRVPSLPRTRIEGRVFTVNPRVDPETGTGQVTVEVPNAERRLIPGLFSYVDLETRRLVGVQLVPSEAVLERQGRTLVFRVVEGQAHWTYITTGVTSRGMVEVLEGLDVGDVVAVAGHFALAHESPVDVERLVTPSAQAFR